MLPLSFCPPCLVVCWQIEVGTEARAEQSASARATIERLTAERDAATALVLQITAVDKDAIIAKVRTAVPGLASCLLLLLLA